MNPLVHTYWNIPTMGVDTYFDSVKDSSPNMASLIVWFLDKPAKGFQSMRRVLLGSIRGFRKAKVHPSDDNWVTLIDALRSTSLPFDVARGSVYRYKFIGGSYAADAIRNELIEAALDNTPHGWYDWQQKEALFSWAVNNYDFECMSDFKQSSYDVQLMQLCKEPSNIGAIDKWLTYVVAYSFIEEAVFYTYLACQNMARPDALDLLNNLVLLPITPVSSKPGVLSQVLCLGSFFDTDLPPWLISCFQKNCFKDYEQARIVAAWNSDSLSQATQLAFLQALMPVLPFKKAGRRTRGVYNSFDCFEVHWKADSLSTRIELLHNMVTFYKPIQPDVLNSEEGVYLEYAMIFLPEYAPLFELITGNINEQWHFFEKFCRSPSEVLSQNVNSALF